ncbi:hypothetical protein TRFO_18199 [Tritrichomonas foetus]|uniref:Uncharacterized protein n=1 Tax=Tritrichomonas foetus TaxID=1144522 RepID=A0A1J4KM20_9EUKA|nr:hypothetical protein TRFO_18199 [Tritrichomonas foetus]|eukprot:OHT12186.1 hypothetical protein TRFO_18199 [Tritrichomonas foetus]
MRPKLPKAYEDTQISMINAKDALDQFADNFNDFLGRVQQEKIKRIEEKERELIGDISSNKKKSRPAKHEVEEEPETLDIGDDDDGGDDE